MSMYTGASLPACVASADALANASHSLFFCSLHRRDSAASDASCQPKTKQDPLMGASIDLHVSRTAIGGVGLEDGASIDGRFDGLDRGRGRGQFQRLWGHGGG